jgi:hypothetical protein
MIKIDYPSFNYKIKGEEGREFIFDEIRKRWVRLTPEEWVRQNTIQYLLQIKYYPYKLFSIEKEIKLGELKKRCDIIVYHNAQPWMIIECKEPDVSINKQVMQQILRYHLAIPVPYLCLTNGTNVYIFKKENDVFLETTSFPAYGL